MAGLALFAATGAAVQQHGHEGGAPAQGGHAGYPGGYIPERGPALHAAPPARAEAPPPQSRPEQGRPPDQRRGDSNAARFDDRPGHPNAPHVHDNGEWVGHDGGAGRYHVDQPWAHGRFPGQFGQITCTVSEEEALAFLV